MLDIRKYLTSRGWNRDQINFALMQIIARAIYPYSELKTVCYLRENTALAEMFSIPKEKITKDALYESAKRLWDEYRWLEDWLHDRGCSMFGIEEKILLFDITNSYFEGKMENSELCQYGRGFARGRTVMSKLLTFLLKSKLVVKCGNNEYCRVKDYPSLPLLEGQEVKK